MKSLTGHSNYTRPIIIPAREVFFFPYTYYAVAQSHCIIPQDLQIVSNIRAEGEVGVRVLCATPLLHCRRLKNASTTSNFVGNLILK